MKKLQRFIKYVGVLTGVVLISGLVRADYPTITDIPKNGYNYEVVLSTDRGDIYWFFNHTRDGTWASNYDDSTTASTYSTYIYYGITVTNVAAYVYDTSNQDYSVAINDDYYGITIWNGA